MPVLSQTVTLQLKLCRHTDDQLEHYDSHIRLNPSSRMVYIWPLEEDGLLHILTWIQANNQCFHSLFKKIIIKLFCCVIMNLEIINLLVSADANKLHSYHKQSSFL